MSLFEIASAIVNKIQQGLAASGNFRVPIQQIEDEVAITRNAILGDLAKKGILEMIGLYQTIPCIDMETVNGCCYSKEPIPQIYFPYNLNPILYIGGSCFKKPFKVLMGNDGIHNEFSPSSKLFAAEILPDYKLKLHNTKIGVLGMRAIFNNPMDLKKYKCICIDENTEYPCPGDITQMVINQLVKDYIAFFYRNNRLPNTQEEKVPMATK
jgi:hypothetical protein